MKLNPGKGSHCKGLVSSLWFQIFGGGNIH